MKAKMYERYDLANLSTEKKVSTNKKVEKLTIKHSVKHRNTKKEISERKK